MNEETITRLQAMYGSSEVLGYLISQLPEKGLKSGWIEEGLLVKGLQESSSSKFNQENYFEPTHEAIHLMADRAMDAPGRTGIFILGEPGLESSKLVVVLSDDSSDPGRIKLATTIWLRDYTPHDLIRLVLKYLLGEKLSTEFEEPNLDYIEQLRIDAIEWEAAEVLSLHVPGRKFNTSSWIKQAIQHPEDEYNVALRCGKLRQIPAFALLFSRWLIDLPVFEDLNLGVAAAIFRKEDSIELAIWDNPRELATFAVLLDTDFEDITRKFLMPAWLESGNRIEPPTRTRDVVISEPTGGIMKGLKQSFSLMEPARPTLSVEEQKAAEALTKLVDDLRVQMESFSPADITERLENVERQAQILTEQLSSEMMTGEFSGDEGAAVGMLRNKLGHVLDRLEELSARLETIEDRASHLLE
ncbi:MAG: hypothetical protein ACXADC_06055 [Candidatus Thorarchaeota archaeon]